MFVKFHNYSTNWTVTVSLSSAKLHRGLFSRGINCCVLRIIGLLEVNCLQLGGGGSVSASQNQDWCVSDHPSSGPLVLISLLLGVIGSLTKVKLVMDLTILYLVSTKMLNFELSDHLDKWHKELSFSGELSSWPRQSEWVSVGCLRPYLVFVTPVLWRGSNFSNWNVTMAWWYKPVSRRERVMTNCWSMTITGQWIWLVIVSLMNMNIIQSFMILIFRNYLSWKITN